MKNKFDFELPRRAICSVLLVLMTASCATKDIRPEVTEPSNLPASLEDATNSAWRTDGNSQRDRYRHPLETLKFFDVRSNMTVVEISPATGWFTEILAPFLAEKGTYIAAVSRPQSGPTKGLLNPQFSKWISTHPKVGKIVKVTEFNLPTQIEIAPAGSADRVLTFINMHNWMEIGQQ